MTYLNYHIKGKRNSFTKEFSLYMMIVILLFQLQTSEIQIGLSIYILYWNWIFDRKRKRKIQRIGSFSRRCRYSAYFPAEIVGEDWRLDEFDTEELCGKLKDLSLVYLFDLNSKIVRYMISRRNIYCSNTMRKMKSFLYYIGFCLIRMLILYYRSSRYLFLMADHYWIGLT